jgi:hypothetical protein
MDNRNVAEQEATNAVIDRFDEAKATYEPHRALYKHQEAISGDEEHARRRPRNDRRRHRSSTNARRIAAIGHASAAHRCHSLLHEAAQQQRLVRQPAVMCAAFHNFFVLS